MHPGKRTTAAIPGFNERKIVRMVADSPACPDCLSPNDQNYKQWLHKAGGTVALYDYDLDIPSNYKINETECLIIVTAANEVREIHEDIWMHCVLVVKRGSQCTIVDPAAFLEDGVVQEGYSVIIFISYILNNIVL